jgi:hypothetical protein
VSYLVFGDPLYTKEHSGFSFSVIPNHFLLYIIALTVFVPGGLFFTSLYNGKRRPEIISTVFLLFAFYSFYNFSGQPSGFLKSLVLGPRFFIPLLPVLAFATAESAPRILGSIFLKFDSQKYIIRGGITLITIGVILTNALFHEWAEVHENIQEKIIEYVPDNSLVITNFQSTLKYVSELQGYPSRINYFEVSPDEIENMDQAYIVFVQRSESLYWRETADSENRFLKSIPIEPVFNQEYLDNYHLKIYRTD